MENIEESDFRSFCKNYLNFIKKPSLAIFITTVLVFIYGIRLFNVNIGIDTELYMGEKYINWREIGRFGLVFLQYLFKINEFNPILQNCIAILFMIFGTLAWCHLFDTFSNHKIDRKIYFLFSFIFTTSAVWAEQIYFTCQATETCFIVILCPITIFLMLNGIIRNNKLNTTISTILLLFTFSIYQAAITMFCAGMLICFLLVKEQTNYNEKSYWFMGLKILALTVIALVGYLIADIFITKFIFNTQKQDYLSSQIGIKSNYIVSICQYICSILFAKNSLLTLPIDCVISALAKSGSQAVDSFHNQDLLCNSLFFPALICYIYFILRNKNKTSLYIIIALLIPMCIFVLPLTAGGSVVPRAQYSLPLILGFIFLYVIYMLPKKLQIIISSLIFLSGFYAMQKSAMLIYSDQIRYEHDLQLAKELNERIKDISHNVDIPVFIYGANQEIDFSKNFISGDCLGKSIFAWNDRKDPTDATYRGLAFMNAHNYRYYPPKNADLVNKARFVALNMPSYPDKNCIQNLNNVIVIKLSETTYLP